MAPEIAFARWLACCVHPTAAWRILPASGRVLLAFSYAAVSFVASLSVLLLV